MCSCSPVVIKNSVYLQQKGMCHRAMCTSGLRTCEAAQYINQAQDNHTRGPTYSSSVALGEGHHHSLLWQGRQSLAYCAQACMASQSTNECALQQQPSEITLEFAACCKAAALQPIAVLMHCCAQES